MKGEMMPKYRKKPVVIEAFRARYLVAASKTNWEALPQCVVDAYDKGDVVFLPDGILINTLEGQHRADIDDWVIKGVKGELYPIKNDIFLETYEKVLD
jgi:hypothetical protein